MVDDPETVRARKNMEISSQVTYTGLMNKHADMEARRPIMEQGIDPAGGSYYGNISYVPPKHNLAPSLSTTHVDYKR